MKNGKRLLALALVLLMVLALSACGAKKNELEGTWQGQMDMRGILVASVDDGMDFESFGIEPFSFGDFLGDCSVNMTFEFKSDGTYVQSVDEASVQQLREITAKATKEFYYELMVQALMEQLKEFSPNGSFANVEELDAFLLQTLGTGLDDTIAASIGGSLDDYVDEILGDDIWSEVLDGLQGEGKYETKDGKLFLSDGLEHDVDPEIYDTYTISGSTLTLTDNVGGENVSSDYQYKEFLYPMSFEKAA